MYALDAEQPLTAVDREIVSCLIKGETVRAETLARESLAKDGGDLVPAWTLSQILRVKRRALVERKALADRIVAPASVPILLFRLHVCRLASEELPPRERGTGFPMYERFKRDEQELDRQLRVAARDSLGVLIGVTNVSSYWVVRDRRTLAEFAERHPKGPDVRPLLARAWMSGMHIGPYSTLYTDDATDPLEPRPKKTLEIALAMIKAHENEALGHFYAGVAQFCLKHIREAGKQMELALSTGMLPPIYEQSARDFLVKPSFAALRHRFPY